MNNQPNNNQNTNQNSQNNNQNSGQNNANQNQPKPVQAQPVQKNNGPMMPKSDQNKSFMKIAGVILAVVVLAALLGNGKWKKNGEVDNTVSTAEQEGCKPGYLFSETTGKPCVSDSATASVTDLTPRGNSTNPSSYDQALKQYAGKTMSVDASCDANDLTVDSGTRVLVANNSAKTLTLSLGTKSASLRPYHYFTTTLRTAGDVALMCNGETAATLTVR